MIKVTYNGRTYRDIKDAMMQSIVDGVRKSIEDKLKPYRHEIASNNGIVNINIPKDFKGANVELKNMPEELLERLKIALHS